MVRLQRTMKIFIFNRKNEMSQFHYGSITTKEPPTEKKEEVISVSIPLWFDYNELKKEI